MQSDISVGSLATCLRLPGQLPYPDALLKRAALAVQRVCAVFPPMSTTSVHFVLSSADFHREVVAARPVGSVLVLRSPFACLFADHEMLDRLVGIPTSGFRPNSFLADCSIDSVFHMHCTAECRADVAMYQIQCRLRTVEGQKEVLLTSGIVRDEVGFPQVTVVLCTPLTH